MVSKNLIYLGTCKGAILKLQLGEKSKIENIQTIYGMFFFT
jgi:hypothetical protein